MLMLYVGLLEPALVHVRAGTSVFPSRQSVCQPIMLNGFVLCPKLCRTDGKIQFLHHSSTN